MTMTMPYTKRVALALYYFHAQCGADFVEIRKIREAPSSQFGNVDPRWIQRACRQLVDEALLEADEANVPNSYDGGKFNITSAGISKVEAEMAEFGVGSVLDYLGRL